jgi:nicotinamide phosphoribosyltransferase
MKFVKENDGYFPVRIEALAEGTCANIHVPVYQIFAEKGYARLVTFLETIMTQVWYPSNVATLSRRCKDLITTAFDKSVDDGARFLLMSRLHDFGFRGATCVEAATIGGIAHLLNFEGSDTMSAAFYAQMYLNGGKPVATSIPATEHSVMTSWKNERDALRNMIQKFGGWVDKEAGIPLIFACVMDSYNYTNALDKILPQVAEEHKEKGGLMVLRPDSGDPVECILEALAAGEKTFGCTTNEKGFKVLNGVAAIQGDGIGPDTIALILEATLKAGFSAQNVAFGMGGGLLQRHNRDTMGFATKLSYVKNKDGSERLIMKKPKTDGGKISLPGILKVVRDKEGQLSILPRGFEDEVDAANELKVVYNHGPVKDVWDDFDTVRARVEEQWPKVQKNFDPISVELKKVIAQWQVDHDIEYAKQMAQ